MKKLTKSEAVELLREKDNFLILTHKRPDGDTLGSAAALCSGLRRLGKKAYLLKNSGTTGKYLPFVEKFFTDNDFDTEGCYIVSVDVASLSLLPEGAPQNVELAIDHHPSNTEFAENLLLDGKKSACGEIIFSILKELNGSITKDEADLLYIALSTDTGCFQYGNTNADTFTTASELTLAGADVAGLNITFFRSVSKPRLTLEGMIYSSLGSYMDNRLNIAVVTKEMIEKAGATDDDMDDLASLPGKVYGNKVSALIKENDEGFSKVSLRSTGEVNVSDICAMFGGGGHAMASGCEIKEPPYEAAKTLRKVLEDALK